MLNQNFVFLAILFNFIGGIDYLILTLKGKVKPNKITWLLWGVAPLIGFFAEVNQGVSITSLFTFIIGFDPLLVFFASFLNKKAQWKIGRIDILCGSLSILGLILWYLSQDSKIALIFALSADALASVPSIVKAYHHPETENYRIFLLGLISSLITLLTIRTWSLGYYAFPLSVFITCLIFILLVKFRLGKRISFSTRQT